LLRQIRLGQQHNGKAEFGCLVQAPVSSDILDRHGTALRSGVLIGLSSFIFQESPDATLLLDPIIHPHIHFKRFC
jgi:hypothetical protein